MRWLAPWFAAGALVGCSWILDPGDLTAEGLGPSDPDAAEVVEADAADASGAETADPTADTASDAVATGDTGDDDTDDDALASEDADAQPPGDAVADAALVEDAADAREVVIARPGVGGCELDYKAIIITGCPQSCPQAAGWRLVFDASESVGVQSFHWEFAVTNNYAISPEVATTGRVEVTVEVPSCILFGATMGSATVLARLRVDGELTEHVADVSFSVRNVTSCGANQGNCASPP